MKKEETNKNVEAKIEEVLDKIRPFLQREGGNIHVDHYDYKTGICYVTMSGACQGCSLASFDVSESIEVLLIDEIPEITKVELIDSNKSSLLASMVNNQKNNKKKGE